MATTLELLLLVTIGYLVAVATYFVMFVIIRWLSTQIPRKEPYQDAGRFFQISRLNPLREQVKGATNGKLLTLALVLSLLEIPTIIVIHLISK